MCRLLFPALFFFELIGSQFAKAAEIDLEAISRDPNRWEDIILDFRHEHNFSLSLGFGETEWKIQRFASLGNKNIKARETVSRFSYAYHMQVYRSFGTFLGSGFGFVANEPSKDLEIENQYMFPSLTAGAVFEPNRRFRLGAGLDYRLERWEKIKPGGKDSDGPTLSATARASDLFFSLEWFYRISLALKLETHRCFSKMVNPRSAGSSEFNSSIERKDTWVGLGISYHLL